VPEGFSGLSKGKRRPGKHTNLLNPAALRIQNQSTLALDLKLMEVSQVKVLTVACSDSHALACTNTGAVFAWGRTRTLSSASGPRKTRLEFLSRPFPARSRGCSKCLRNRSSKTFVVAVACGNKHSLCLSDSQELFAWGSNLEG